MAPIGARLDELLTLQRRRTLPQRRFAITTPSHLLNLVFDHNRAAVAAYAANGLIGNRPDQSARLPVTFGQKLILAAMTFLLLAGLAVGGLFWLGFSLLAGAILSAAIVVRLFAAAGSFDNRSREQILSNLTKTVRLPHEDLPHYTVIAALHDEASSVAQLVRGLDKLDYPAAKLDIKLVVEADDHATQRALAALDLPPRYQIICVPDGTPRTKPRALNAALALARGQYTCVFDAEDIPEPSQLREAAAMFAQAGDDVACLQARLVIDNVDDSWLTRMFAIEYAALFDVLLPGLAWLKMPIPLGGTSNHFRTRVLRQLHGWDAWNVTEDADLGLRLARFGYKIGTLVSSTGEEAPADLSMWMRQRRRWTKGWMQTLLVHLRSPAATAAEMGLLPAIVALALMGGGMLGSLLGPLFAAATLADIVWGDLLRPTSVVGLVASTCWCFVFLAGLGAAFWPALLGMHRRGLLEYSGWLLTLPAYWLLLTIAAWWGMLDLVRRPFHWHKTGHGFARTSRRDGRIVH